MMSVESHVEMARSEIVAAASDLMNCADISSAEFRTLEKYLRALDKKTSEVSGVMAALQKRHHAKHKI
jgi:hypothetical protein